MAVATGHSSTRGLSRAAASGSASFTASRTRRGWSYSV